MKRETLAANQYYHYQHDDEILIIQIVAVSDLAVRYRWVYEFDYGNYDLIGKEFIFPIKDLNNNNRIWMFMNLISEEELTEFLLSV